jgi:GWxTD domain-containing protein
MTRYVVFTLMLVAAVLLASASRCRAGYLLDVDKATFRASDTLGYVEVYVAIQRSGLNYSQADTGLKADFLVVLDILKDNQVTLADSFLARDLIDSSEAKTLMGQYFTHAFRFIMLPGNYGLKASLYQTGTDPRDVVNDTLVIPKYSLDSLNVSDIELGTKLDFVQERSPFVKNGVKLIPNPTGFFGTKLPMFYYYLEVYGLNYDSTRSDSFVVFQSVRDAESEKLVRPVSRKAHHIIGSTAVVADGFPVTTLRTGTYELDLEIKDQRSGHSVTTRKRFWTYRKEDLEAGRAFKAQPSYEERVSDVAPNFLDVVDVDSALGWMKYILTREESNQIKRLTADGKREFLNNYWKGREMEEPGATNKYFARVVEANRRYTFLKRPGWKTDRGRIFVLYGAPDRVVNGSVTSSTYDNEVWEYDKLKGGVIFVFADVRGYGDYDLVHSTMPGELYNPNWYLSATQGQQLPDQPLR